MLIIYKKEEDEEDKTLEILKLLFNNNSTFSREVENLEDEKSDELLIYDNNEITLYGIDTSYILEDNIMKSASLITGFNCKIIKENDIFKLILSPEDKSLEEKTLKEKYDLVDKIRDDKFDNVKIIEHLSKDNIVLIDKNSELVNPNYQINEGYIKEIDGKIFVEIKFDWIRKD